MAPSATGEQNGSSNVTELSPPKLYPVHEAHFPGYLEPQPDGYPKARRMGRDEAAIIIDNGMDALLNQSLILYLTNL